MSREPIWADLALPLLKRLDDRWQSEGRATRGLAWPSIRVESAARGGFVERRQHWLTRRWQIRLSVPGYNRHKIGLGAGR